MSTKNEKDSLSSDPIPGSSYIQVAHSLEKESHNSATDSEGKEPPLHIDGEGGGSVKSELSHPEESEGETEGGILITSGIEGETSLRENEASVQFQSLNTYDVQAMEEMINAASSERNRKRFHRIILCISFLFLLISSCLVYALYVAMVREKYLQGKVDLLTKENQRLEFENKMNGSTNMSPLFEFDSCYFNLKASASLGKCTEELTQNAYDWYDWGVENLYSLGEEFFEQNDGDNAESDSKEDNMSNIFDDFFENLSSIFVPVQGDTEWIFDLDMDE